MTTAEIIREYLEQHGFDGLCDDGCGCEKDDLFPCGDCWTDCEPGYFVPCDCGSHDWHIQNEKPEAARAALEVKK